MKQTSFRLILSVKIEITLIFYKVLRLLVAFFHLPCLQLALFDAQTFYFHFVSPALYRISLSSMWVYLNESRGRQSAIGSSSERDESAWSAPLRSLTPKISVKACLPVITFHTQLSALLSRRPVAHFHPKHHLSRAGVPCCSQDK